MPNMRHIQKMVRRGDFSEVLALIDKLADMFAYYASENLDDKWDHAANILAGAASEIEERDRLDAYKSPHTKAAAKKAIEQYWRRFGHPDEIQIKQTEKAK